MKQIKAGIKKDSASRYVGNLKLLEDHTVNRHGHENDIVSHYIKPGH